MSRAAESTSRSRFASRNAALLVMVLFCAAPAPARLAWQDGADDVTDEPADRLEAYLLDRGMLELLVRQLEQRLASERTSRARTDVAERLASVYARLLSDASGAAEQRRWESAAARLLQGVPEANTIELRLSLARSARTPTGACANLNAKKSERRGWNRRGSPKHWGRPGDSGRWRTTSRVGLRTFSGNWPITRPLRPAMHCSTSVGFWEQTEAMRRRLPHYPSRRCDTSTWREPRSPRRVATRSGVRRPLLRNGYPR